MPGRIYAGQTGATSWPSGRTGAATLAGRIGGNHLRGRIRGSTFRFTLCASLRGSRGLVVVEPRRLAPASEARLSEWIAEHLEVAVHRFLDPDPLADLEHSVLAALDPPLNLEGGREHPCAAGSRRYGARSPRQRLVDGVSVPPRFHS